MKKLLASCLLLVSCGASTTTSTGASIAGNYSVTGTVTGSTCPGPCPAVQADPWSVARANDAWLLTLETASGPATVAGDTLTGDVTTSVPASGCTVNAAVHATMTITAAGFSGHMSLHATGPSCSPPADCTCTYDITATR